MSKRTRLKVVQLTDGEWLASHGDVSTLDYATAKVGEAIVYADKFAPGQLVIVLPDEVQS